MEIFTIISHSTEPDGQFISSNILKSTLHLPHGTAISDFSTNKTLVLDHQDDTGAIYLYDVGKNLGGDVRQNPFLDSSPTIVLAVNSSLASKETTTIMFDRSQLESLCMKLSLSSGKKYIKLHVSDQPKFDCKISFFKDNGHDISGSKTIKTSILFRDQEFSDFPDVKTVVTPTMFKNWKGDYKFSNVDHIEGNFIICDVSDTEEASAIARLAHDVKAAGVFITKKPENILIPTVVLDLKHAALKRELTRENVLNAKFMPLEGQVEPIRFSESACLPTPTKSEINEKTQTSSWTSLKNAAKGAATGISSLLGYSQKSESQVKFEGLLKKQPWIQSDGQPSYLFHEAIDLYHKNKENSLELQNLLMSSVKWFETNDNEVDMFFLSYTTLLYYKLMTKHQLPKPELETHAKFIMKLTRRIMIIPSKLSLYSVDNMCIANHIKFFMTQNSSAISKDDDVLANFIIIRDYYCEDNEVWILPELQKKISKDFIECKKDKLTNYLSKNILLSLCIVVEDNFESFCVRLFNEYQALRSDDHAIFQAHPFVFEYFVKLFQKKRFDIKMFLEAIDIIRFEDMDKSKQLARIAIESLNFYSIGTFDTFEKIVTLLDCSHSDYKTIIELIKENVTKEIKTYSQRVNTRYYGKKVRILHVENLLLGKLNYIFKDIGSQKILISFLDSIVQDDYYSFFDVMNFAGLLHKFFSQSEDLKERETIIENLMSSVDNVIKFRTYSLSDVFKVADQDREIFCSDGQEKFVTLNVAKDFIFNIGHHAKEPQIKSSILAICMKDEFPPSWSLLSHLLQAMLCMLIKFYDGNLQKASELYVALSTTAQPLMQIIEHLFVTLLDRCDLKCFKDILTMNESVFIGFHQLWNSKFDKTLYHKKKLQLFNKVQEIVHGWSKKFEQDQLTLNDINSIIPLVDASKLTILEEVCNQKVASKENLVAKAHEISELAKDLRQAFIIRGDMSKPNFMQDIFQAYSVPLISCDIGKVLLTHSSMKKSSSESKMTLIKLKKHLKQVNHFLNKNISDLEVLNHFYLHPSIFFKAL